MLRLIVLILIGGLMYLGLRSLLSSLRGADHAKEPEAVTDLRACSRCGTFVEAEQLDTGRECGSCRDRKPQ